MIEIQHGMEYEPKNMDFSVIRIWGTKDLWATAEPIRFVDKGGRCWYAPEGIVVDGASKPWLTRVLVGGKTYKPEFWASVLHDHYCDLKLAASKDVHRMFLKCLEALGVGRIRRTILGRSVIIGGPRWRYRYENLDSYCKQFVLQDDHCDHTEEVDLLRANHHNCAVNARRGDVPTHWLDILMSTYEKLYIEEKLESTGGVPV